MIYGDLILEQKRNELFQPSNKIMLEYYKNEIDMLRSTIQYQNEVSLCESTYELEILQEGFVSNIIDRIKEIIQNFIKWIGKVIQSIKDFFTKDSKTVDQKANDIEEELKKAETSEEIKKAASKTGSLTVTEDDTYILKRLKSEEFIDDVEKSFSSKLNLARPLLNRLNFDIGKRVDDAIKAQHDTEKKDDINDYIDGVNKVLDEITNTAERINELNSGIHINEYIDTYEYKTEKELKSAAMSFIADDRRTIRKIEQGMNSVKRKIEEDEEEMKYIERDIRNKEKQVNGEIGKSPIVNKTFSTYRRYLTTFIMLTNIVAGTTLGFYNQATRQLYSQLKITKAK